MIAYEFYWKDDTGRDHFIGILPERRKNPARITQDSVINWGKKVIGDDTEIKDIFFTQVAINDF